jgi:hypothetical protein
MEKRDACFAQALEAANDIELAIYKSAWSNNSATPNLLAALSSDAIGERTGKSSEIPG